MMISLITALFSSKVTLFATDIIGNDCLPKKSGVQLVFFGLKPWYYYLPKSYFDNCSIKTFHFLSGGGTADVALVLLAVVDDLLMIAGIVAVAFVLIGAFKYVASQGNPEQTAQAQSTIINALLGTAIAITAAVFVNFLGQKLGG